MTTRNKRSFAAAAAALGLGALIVLAPAGAQGTGTRTLALKMSSERDGFNITRPDLAKKGKTVIGDVIAFNSIATVDGHRVGTREATVTITARRPAGFEDASGVATAIYHLTGGDIYAEALIHRKPANGIIIGGTGDYAGISGTVVVGPTTETLTFEGGR